MASLFFSCSLSLSRIWFSCAFYCFILLTFCTKNVPLFSLSSLFGCFSSMKILFWRKSCRFKFFCTLLFRFYPNESVQQLKKSSHLRSHTSQILDFGWKMHIFRIVKTLKLTKCHCSNFNDLDSNLVEFQYSSNNHDLNRIK